LPSGEQVEKDVDFTSPFKRIDMIEELESIMNFKFLPLEDTPEVLQILIEKIKEHKVEVPPSVAVARILDKLVGHFIEPNLINQTFLLNHPQIMSPLAKWHRSKQGLVERFELFINGLEYLNA
jgi:lysyl-tRNA synthetase class 2